MPRPKGNVLQVGHFCTNTPNAGRATPWPLGHSRDCAEQVGRKTRQVVQSVHNQCSDILRESVFRPRLTGAAGTRAMVQGLPCDAQTADFLKSQSRFVRFFTLCTSKNKFKVG